MSPALDALQRCLDGLAPGLQQPDRLLLLLDEARAALASARVEHEGLVRRLAMHEEAFSSKWVGRTPLLGCNPHPHQTCVPRHAAMAAALPSRLATPITPLSPPFRGAHPPPPSPRTPHPDPPAIPSLPRMLPAVGSRERSGQDWQALLAARESEVVRLRAEVGRMRQALASSSEAHKHGGGQAGEVAALQAQLNQLSTAAMWVCLCTPHVYMQ